MPDEYRRQWYEHWGNKVAAVGLTAGIALFAGLYAARRGVEYSAGPEKERKYDYATRAKRSLEKRVRMVREFFSGDSEISDLVVPKEKTP
jgi:hypothetical protein